MAASLDISTIPDDVIKKIKKLRFNKDKKISALILKINTETDEVEVEEELEDSCLEEIQENVCEHQPRYIIISYVYDHGDGRTSYPLFFVFYSPRGGKGQLNMRYAGTKTKLQQQAGITKDLNIQDFEEQGLTAEVFKARMQTFT